MMKKRILIGMAMAFMFSLLPVSAYAWTENHITKEITVSEDEYLTESTAPSLVIEASSDHSSDFYFTLYLNGAEWAYNDSGEIRKGVSYQKYTPSMMKISVTLSDFDARQKDLKIPLICRITEGGTISVRVDADGSTVSSGLYVFATNIDGKITVNTKDIPVINNSQRKGRLEDIVIHDTTSISYSEGDVITLTLSNGFQFSEDPEILETGKFEGCTTFERDEKSPSKAYLKFLEDTHSERGGKITLSGLEIEPIKNGSYGSIQLKVEVGEDSASIRVAEYKKVESTEQKIVIHDMNTSDPRPLVSGTGGENTNIAIRLDGVDLGQIKVDEDGKWSLPYPDKMEDLKEGVHTISVGYYKSSYKPTTTLINESIMEFTTKYERPESRIVITIGANHYTVDGIGKDTDTPAIIDSQNRTLIPIRMFADAMGVTDQKWDAETKTAFFMDRDGNTIRVKAGESVIEVNGKGMAMDTSAIIQNNRMLVPMRALMTAFGVEDQNITWDPTTKIITIIKK